MIQPVVVLMFRVMFEKTLIQITLVALSRLVKSTDNSFDDKLFGIVSEALSSPQKP